MNSKQERHAAKMRGALTQHGRNARFIIDCVATDFQTSPAAIQNSADKRPRVVRARHRCFVEMAARGIHPVRIAQIMGGMDRGTVYKVLQRQREYQESITG